MTKVILAMMVGGSLLAGASIAAPAAAQSADETYLPGPGGGEEVDGGAGTPPLESTGMEDGIGGSCDCSLIARSSAGSASGLASLLALGIVVVRRRAEQRSRAR